MQFAQRWLGIGHTGLTADDATASPGYYALHTLKDGGDSPALFCWAFLAIAVFGAGPWSIDGLRRPRAQATALETADA
jgi:hypothetical protein